MKQQKLKNKTELSQLFDVEEDLEKQRKTRPGGEKQKTKKKPKKGKQDQSLDGCFNYC